MGTGQTRPVTATMTTPSPRATLTIPDLLRALDARISEEISLARSTPRSRNSSPHPMVSLLYSRDLFFDIATSRSPEFLGG